MNNTNSSGQTFKFGISALMIITFFGFLCYMILPGIAEGGRGDIYFLFFVNILFSIVMIIKKSNEHSYSVELIHWLFYFFFFGVAAMIQYNNSTYPWGLIPTDDEIFSANLQLLLWGLMFLFGSMSYNHKPSKRETKLCSISNSDLWIFSVIALGITVYKISAVGLYNLFSRGTSTITFGGVDSSIRMLLHFGMNSFVTFNFAFCITKKRIDRFYKSNFLLIVAMICLLICCFPLGVSRYNAAVIYFGVALLGFSNSFKGRRFVYVFIGAFMILFPLFDAFRYVGFGDVNFTEQFKIVFQNITDSYTEGHYDAYSMYMQVVRFVGLNGKSKGRQLLGNVLFFIPRSMWENKPVGTGHTVMLMQGREFTNVSAPLPAECYMNFGLVGVVFFGFIIGRFMKKIDCIYWSRENLRNEKKYSALDIFYPFGMMFFFFIMRGDLLSSVSYTIAYAFVFVVMYKYTNRNMMRLR